MNIQSVVTALIILSALLYAGSLLWGKVKSFSPKKNGCEADCGCSSKLKI